MTTIYIYPPASSFDDFIFFTAWRRLTLPTCSIPGIPNGAAVAAVMQAAATSGRVIVSARPAPGRLGCDVVILIVATGRVASKRISAN